MPESRPAQADDPAPEVWLDHFVVGIDDRDRGIRDFMERTGVRPGPGGEHPALGTHNALVSLGPRAYLEILAPVPGREAHPFFAAARGYSTLTPFRWALATDDLAEVRRRLTAAGFAPPPVTRGARRTTDGTLLEWTMFTFGPERPTLTPFFIQWAPGTPHPAGTTPGGCSLADWTLTTRDARTVAALLEAVGMDQAVREGPDRLTIHLRSPSGPVVLGVDTGQG